MFAPVAQLDRASDFESAGRPFESGRVRHSFQYFSQTRKRIKNVCNGRVTASKRKVSMPPDRRSPFAGARFPNREFWGRYVSLSANRIYDSSRIAPARTF